MNESRFNARECADPDVKHKVCKYNQEMPQSHNAD